RFAVRVSRGEARIHAGRLLTNDRPLLRRRRPARVGPARDLLSRDLRGAKAIGEPARIRYLVNRVDVEGACVRRRTSLDDEQVVGDFVEEIDLVRRRAGGISFLGLSSDRIVAVKARS